MFFRTRPVPPRPETRRWEGWNHLLSKRDARDERRHRPMRLELLEDRQMLSVTTWLEEMALERSSRSLNYITKTCPVAGRRFRAARWS